MHCHLVIYKYNIIQQNKKTGNFNILIVVQQTRINIAYSHFYEKINKMARLI